MYLTTATQTNEVIQLSDKIQIASILVSLCIAVIGFVFFGHFSLSNQKNDRGNKSTELNHL